MATTARQRRLRHQADARRTILDGADALLAEAGLDGFSMRLLGKRSGFTAPTLYHYFRDKTALLEAAVERRLRELIGELRALPRAPDVVARVCDRTGAFARFGLRHPGHYQLLVIANGEEGLEPPAGEEVRAILVEPIEELGRSEGLAPHELERLRQGLWSLVHGFILLQTTRPNESWEPDLLEASLAAMIHGSRALGPAAAAPGETTSATPRSEAAS